MPSFLSKVFGRKKDDKEHPQGRFSDASLLGGKFEAVSPTVSPSATHFLEAAANGNDKGNGHGSGKGKEKDTSFPTLTLFRSKSRPSSPEALQRKADLPPLSLSLDLSESLKDERALGVVFEADPDARIVLTDSAIGERRLSPAETFTLVRVCSQYINTRGLETLGIMHPHWYSASPDIQRRLISLFIHSLASNGTQSTVSSSPISHSSSAFESEINYTRSPHDVAAVLRWGLRHLQPEGQSFGNSESWYQTFLDAERESDYPPKAFSEKLAPQLPSTHLNLLVATLELFSSLAAHAETNSTSGAKLSKLFGLWLLTSSRVEDTDNWASFYERWERSGRKLEHLFLSRIREEATTQRLPTRLLELVQQYPFIKGHPSPTTDLDLLPRPRFSTWRFDALFVRIETELPSLSSPKPKHDLLRLVTDALQASNAFEGEHNGVWEKLKQIYSNDTSASSPDAATAAYPGLSRILADDTIRFLSLSSGQSPAKSPLLSPTFSLFPPNSKSPTSPSYTSRTRSHSLTDRNLSSSNGSSSGHTKPATDPSGSPTSPESAIGIDWTQFSTSGFLDNPQSTGGRLASTLFDKDVEKTQPPSAVPSRKSSRKARKSVELPREEQQQKSADPDNAEKHARMSSKSTMISVVQLDEAFIDFWSDALLDPISANWPKFVICKLKSPPTSSSSSPLNELKVLGKRLEWIVLEQAYSTPAPLPTPTPPTPQARARPRPPVSPTGTLGGGTKKRFSFFSGSASRREGSSYSVASLKSKKEKVKVGEMGEMLKEEEDDGQGAGKEKEKEKSGKVETVKLGMPSPKRKSVSSGEVKGEAVVPGPAESGAKMPSDDVVARPIPSMAAADLVPSTELDVAPTSTPKVLEARAPSPPATETALQQPELDVTPQAPIIELPTTTAAPEERITGTSIVNEPVDHIPVTAVEVEAPTVPDRTEPVVTTITEPDDGTTASPSQKDAAPDLARSVEAGVAPTSTTLAPIIGAPSPPVTESALQQQEMDVSVTPQATVTELPVTVANETERAGSTITEPDDDITASPPQTAAAPHVHEGDPFSTIKVLESDAGADNNEAAAAPEELSSGGTIVDDPVDQLSATLDAEAPLASSETEPTESTTIPEPDDVTTSPTQSPSIFQVDIKPDVPDLSGPARMEVMSPTPAGGAAEERALSYTDRMVGPGSVLEHVPIAEDAAEFQADTVTSIVLPETTTLLNGSVTKEAISGEDYEASTQPDVISTLGEAKAEVPEGHTPPVIATVDVDTIVTRDEVNEQPELDAVAPTDLAPSETADTPASPNSLQDEILAAIKAAPVESEKPFESVVATTAEQVEPSEPELSVGVTAFVEDDANQGAEMEKAEIEEIDATQADAGTAIGNPEVETQSGERIPALRTSQSDSNILLQPPKSEPAILEADRIPTEPVIDDLVTLEAIQDVDEVDALSSVPRIESLHTDDDGADFGVGLPAVPVVSVSLVLESPDVPVIVPAAEEPPTAIPTHDEESEVVADVDADQLPPAPEVVVLSGATPGPEIALSTSEPAAVAEIMAKSEAEGVQNDHDDKSVANADVTVVGNKDVDDENLTVLGDAPTTIDEDSRI